MKYLERTYSVQWTELPRKWKDFFAENIFSFHNDCSFKLSMFFELHYDEDIAEFMSEVALSLDLKHIEEIYLDVCW